MDVLAQVIPSVAVILSNIQLTSPLKAVLICRRYNELGSLNPVPWAVSFINCLGYMLYGCLSKNPFLMASVTLGLPINYFALSSALSILGKTGKGSSNVTSWKLEYIVLGGIMLWIAVAFVTGAVLPAVYSGDVGAMSLTIVGYVCITTCMLYYLAPLSVLMEIIKNKDAAGLHTPMVVMNLITSTFWSAYGFGFVGDPVVYAPNMFAMLISAAQIYLKCTFPSIDPTKLQRRMTVDATVGDDEESKTQDSDIPYRHRAGTITQDVLCGDGTVAIIEVTEEEATRPRRSSTVTAIAERVLDVLDILGPPRLSDGEVESATGYLASSTSPRRARRGSGSADSAETGRGGGGGGPGSAGGRGGNGGGGSVRSPMAASQRGGILDPTSGILLSPSRRMRISTSPDSQSQHSQTQHSQQSQRQFTPDRGGRHRRISDAQPQPLPVIDEGEGGLPTSGEEGNEDSGAARGYCK